MKNFMSMVMFIIALTISVPSLADTQEDHDAEILKIVTTDDSRYAVMSLAASQIDIDASAKYLQVGLAAARLDETNGGAISFGYGFGTSKIKLTHTRSHHTKGIAIGGVWKF